MYLRPAAKNYKSVDAIIKPDELFQTFLEILQLRDCSSCFHQTDSLFSDTKVSDLKRKRMQMPTYRSVRRYSNLQWKSNSCHEQRMQI
ncbi:hypothetical protein GQ600_25552 [Phytophthora cactorum]|nr:hypothetical protein GQ600_25552 [Phytophthora cactorum]